MNQFYQYGRKRSHWRRAVSWIGQASAVVAIVVVMLGVIIGVGVCNYRWNEAMYGDGSCAFKKCVQVHQVP